MIGASTFTSFIQNDQPTIDVLNEIGFDGSSFGNHEFDQGRADVDNRILDAADWPYVAANLYDRATGQPAYDDYFLQEFDGVSVGFIGAVTEELPELVSPAGIATLEVRSIIDEVDRVAAYLTDGDDANGEADVLVLLVHEGAATSSIASATDDSAFGQIVLGVDPSVVAPSSPVTRTWRMTTRCRCPAWTARGWSCRPATVRQRTTGTSTSPSTR